MSKTVFNSALYTGAVLAGSATGWGLGYLLARLVAHA
jgi:hypothetical protein